MIFEGSKEATTLKRCELSSVFRSQVMDTEREYFLGKDFVLDVGLSFNSKSKSEEMCEMSLCICRSTIEPKAPHQLQTTSSKDFDNFG